MLPSIPGKGSRMASMEETSLERLVRPRVRTSVAGEAVLLEDLLEERVARREFGALRLEGPPGSGKHTALDYARRRFAGRAEIVVDDDPLGSSAQPGFEHDECVRLFVWRRDSPAPEARRLELASWTRDEWIEYLLANHHDACAGVIARLEHAERYLALNGNARVWSLVLDELARDASLADDLAALRAVLRARFSSPAAHTEACAFMEALLLPHEHAAGELQCVPPAEPRAAPLLAVECVRLLLAAEGVVQGLSCPPLAQELPRACPSALLRVAGPLLREAPTAEARLRVLLAGECIEHHAVVAGLLHRCGEHALADCLRSIRERGGRLPNLTMAELPALAAPGIDLGGILLHGARLEHAKLDSARLKNAFLQRCDLVGASLRGADLRGTRLDGANLETADLERAVLDGTNASHAHLAGARLGHASLREAMLVHADLSRAILDGADLHAAVLRDARLDQTSFVDAVLSAARLDGTDLRTAKLATRWFDGASLIGCHLEQQRIDEPYFWRADLTNALLTATVFRGANLQGARLVNAGLAHVAWPDADLRDADLTHASFHLGSSRSGLVLSAPASWGTRTGFYTDEYKEQGFKSPEEIRKADLRRADLRGAKILATDFYLVDLRGALYTSEQAEHLRACKASL